MLNEREFELINIIGAKLGANQRDLSRHLDLSLGMTNMLLRRMVAKGYIRIRQLNKKKMEYLLTPKGFSEKTRKSVNYTLKTIRSFGLIKSAVRTIINRVYQQGTRSFYLTGESDLVGLVEMVFNELDLKDIAVRRLDVAESVNNGVVFLCAEGKGVQSYPNAIDLVKELSKENSFQGEFNV